jgi:DNA-binding PadR family transcriptional regulator
MSVRHALLALLAEQPMHGYQLRQEFERRTGSTWPLNIGQVYTTLHRLVRDDLAEPAPPEGARAEDVERFRLTAVGTTEVAAWWAEPVQRGVPARDELAIKIALAVTAPGVDVTGVIRAQRTETVRSLHDYTRLKADVPGPEDLAWSLVLDSLVFAAEAEVRWLDHVEARIARAGRSGGTPSVSAAAGVGAAAGAEVAEGAARVTPATRPADTSAEASR